MNSRRFPPSWSIDELEACFVVIDSAQQKLKLRSMSGPEKIKAVVVDVAERSVHESEDENNSDREEKGTQAIFNGDSARLVSNEAGQNGWHQQVLKPSALKTYQLRIAPDLTHLLKMSLDFAQIVSVATQLTKARHPQAVEAAAEGLIRLSIPG